MASAAVGSDAANYAIGYVDGNLEVTKRTLTITADDQTKTYGETFTFDGDEFDTGAGQLVNGDAVTSVSLTSAGAAASALVGDYPVVASAAVGSGLANYAIGYVDGNLEVTKAASTTTVTCPASVVWTPSPATPCTVLVSRSRRTQPHADPKLLEQHVGRYRYGELHLPGRQQPLQQYVSRTS